MLCSQALIKWPLSNVAMRFKRLTAAIWAWSWAMMTAIQSGWECWKWPVCYSWQKEVKRESETWEVAASPLQPVNMMLEMDAHNDTLFHTETFTFGYRGETIISSLKMTRANCLKSAIYRREEEEKQMGEYKCVHYCKYQSESTAC